jgi:hypothetical protein
MSSPLAFDKQGKPFAFHRRTRLLRARLFRNPAARGTCSQVLDVDGNPLYVESESEYPVFRQLVNNVPGLYRLDQCDEDGNEIEDAQPAYITIDPPRNAHGFGGGSDEVSALAVIREMAAVQREMAAIQGQALKALAENHAQILASAAEVMRAPRPAPLPAEIRNAAGSDDDNSNNKEPDEDDDYEDTEIEEEPAPTGMAGMLAQLAKMIDPKDARELGSWLMKKVMEWRREKSDATAPTPAPVIVAAAPVAPAPPAAAPVNVAVSAEPTVATVVVQAAPAVTTSPVSTGSPDAAVNASALSIDDVTNESGRTAEVIGQIPALTTEQLVHVAMINSQLTPEEQAIAEQVMRRMGLETMQRWLVELSAMSVDEAVATVRQAIGERNQRRSKLTR